MTVVTACLALTLFAADDNSHARSRPETLESVVEAHHSALGLHRNVELRMEVYGERFRPTRIPVTHVSTLLWAREGTMERIRHIDRKSNPGIDGLTNNMGDEFRDGTNIKYLANWDPAHPQALTPIYQGSVRGTIQPQTRPILAGDPQTALLLAFSDDGHDRLSLSQLVLESDPPAQLRGSRMVGKCRCLWVHAHRRRADGSGESQVDIYLDPSVNYLTRRLDVRQTLKLPNPDGSQSTNDIHYVVEISDFKDFGEGAYFPLEAVTRYYEARQKAPVSRMRAPVSELVVNGTLSKDAFAFSFPKNAQVVHLPPVQGKTRVELWGADNRPVAEIKGPEDALRLAGLQPGAASAGSASWWKVALGIATPAAILLVALWHRRRRRQ